MEREGQSGENHPEENLDETQELINSAFEDKKRLLCYDCAKKESEWVDEISARLNNPEEFLTMVAQDPRCEIMRKLLFDAKEGDNVPESDYFRDLRPAGKVEIINGKMYVGGWQVDKLGFYAYPSVTESPEVFDRLKTMWISQGILGARRFGERKEEYQKRMKEQDERVKKIKQELDDEHRRKQAERN